MDARVLAISPEAPGTHMSGPAIRYWQIAQALAAEHAVTLAVPGAPALETSHMKIAGYDRRAGAELRGYAAEADVLLCTGLTLYRYPFLRDQPQPMVVDLYDPFLLENLEIHSALPLTEQTAHHRMNISVLSEQLQRGDFFICASEAQRDFWLGMLAANGRLNPLTFGADRTLRRLIDVAPFGVPETPPVQQQRRLKGKHPGIRETDQVIYWGGGLWEWFDPLTAIRAMAAVTAHHPNTKLFFAGVRHPNSDVPPMRMAAAAQALSDDLGLTGRSVFFNDWVPYAERGDYLLEANLGISLHFEHIETRFSYRTRLLDYVWAGLPMVITRGDALGVLAEAHGLARSVPPGDVPAVAQVILHWLDQPDGRAVVAPRAQALAADLRWSKVIAPLAAFCRAPRRAADQAPVSRPRLNPTLLAKGWHSLRARGLRGLWRDVRLYLNLR